MSAATSPDLLWGRHPHPTLPALAELRDYILYLEEVEIPIRILFEGEAWRGDVDPIAFTNKTKGTKGLADYVQVDFRISERLDTGAWAFQLTRLGWARASEGTKEWTVDRVRATLTPERFAQFTPEMMLVPACVIWGKGVTDPASMARWIGPECYGSHSPSVPRIFKVEEVTPTGAHFDPFGGEL